MIMAENSDGRHNIRITVCLLRFSNNHKLSRVLPHALPEQ